TETAHDAEIALSTASGALVPMTEVKAHAAGSTPPPPAISLHNVRFTYRSAAPERAGRAPVNPGRSRRRGREELPPPEIVETPVLHGVSLAVPEGQRVAFVGPSGA